MKKVFGVLIAGGLSVGLVTSTYAQPASTVPGAQPAVQAMAQVLDPVVQQIIAKSKTLGALAQQKQYLVDQAKTFLGEKNYQSALAVASYILSSLDKKSPEALSIVETAKAKLAEIAGQTTQGQQAAQANQAATQAQSSASQVAGSVKGLWGAVGGK